MCRWPAYSGAPILLEEVLFKADHSLIDQSLQALAAQIESPMFLAHVRATTGSPVQRSNCHPFNYKQWLFVHN